MIRTTPFHARTGDLNETNLWTHWSGYLAATKYQPSEKFEYFAIRNGVGLFDTSPLYKYRIVGRDAERFLSGVLTRDIRSCRPGRAQYTIWCDDDGYILEDGVVFRLAGDAFMLTAAEPNLAYFSDLIGSLDVEMTEVTDDLGALAVQGPRSRAVLGSVAPDIESLRYFGLAETKVGDVGVTVSRTGFTGDLGYEVWVEAAHAVDVWDTIWDAAQGHGAVPVGLTALKMARIEAGLLLLDTDFSSSRFAWTDEQRSTPMELGLGWMLRKLDERPFIGRDALARRMQDKAHRWRTVGLVVDWEAYDGLYRDNGLMPPKDHTPQEYESMVYDDDRRRIGYATSYMYSPLLQRHIAIARVRPEHASVGSTVNIEVTVDHRYEMVRAHVTALPHLDLERRTA